MKLALAGGILCAGVAGALCFRRPLLPEAPPAELVRGHLVLRDESGPHFLTAVPPALTDPSGPRPSSAPPGASADVDGNRHAGRGQPPLANVPRLEGDDRAPPPIELVYPREPLAEPEREWPDRPIGEDQDGAEGEAGTLEAHQAAEDRMHRIVDGDDLARLAERYFGDSSRSLEIFDANRDVLRDPDVLPIGTEIRIPADNPGSPTSDAHAPAGTSGAP